MWIYNFHKSGGYWDGESSNPFYMEFIETQWHWHRFLPLPLSTHQCNVFVHLLSIPW